MGKVYICEMPSILGLLRVASSEEGICAVFFEEEKGFEEWLNLYFDEIIQSSEYNLMIINVQEHIIK